LLCAPGFSDIRLKISIIKGFCCSFLVHIIYRLGKIIYTPVLEPFAYLPEV
jgi:hypothetical protein